MSPFVGLMLSPNHIHRACYEARFVFAAFQTFLVPDSSESRVVFTRAHFVLGDDGVTARHASKAVLTPLLIANDFLFRHDVDAFKFETVSVSN